MDITQRVQELLETYMNDHGIELVEISYKKTQEGMTLRILVDTPNGIRMDQCEALNHYVGEVLDRENIITEHYVIEVSSPGLDRPMKTDRDFVRNVGKDIEVTTYEMIDGRKTHEGCLIGMDAGTIVIEREGVSTVIPRNRIALARLRLDF